MSFFFFCGVFFSKMNRKNMDDKVVLWIRKAEIIASHILDSSNLDVNRLSERADIPDIDLNDIGFYIKKEERKKYLDSKYTWEEFNTRRKKVKKTRRLRQFGYAASFAVIVAIALLWRHSGNDIDYFAPGSSKAVLITGSGEKILLSGNFNGNLSVETAAQTLLPGELVSSVPDVSTEQYHTIKVPHGGEYTIELSDGTKVWLNSESELRYPAVFTSGERRVKLTGEAYFEVATDPENPFYCDISGVQVRVTGTAFNISGYEDDADIRIILVEGGLEIGRNDRLLTSLLPGDMFKMDRTNGIYRVCKTDIRMATSWKEGYFFFKDETLKSIIKKLNRWYDVKIITASEKIENYTFLGKINKYESALNILDALGLIRGITYTVSDGNIITIYALE